MSELLEDDPLAAERKIDDILSWRLFEPDDCEDVFRILQADPEIQTRITWTAGVQTVDDIRLRIKGFRQRGGYRGALLEHRQIIGYGALYESKTRQNEYEIGYFCAPDKRGRGYTKKLVISLMEAVKTEDAAESFALYIADSNLPSRAVAASLGFVATDELRVDEVLNCLERRHERPA